MSTKATGNKKHLTLADRAAIEHGISCGENFTQIAHRINKDSSTISKEIRRHLFRVPHFQNETQRKRSECEHYQNCEKPRICDATSPAHLRERAIFQACLIKMAFSWKCIGRQQLLFYTTAGMVSGRFILGISFST